MKNKRQISKESTKRLILERTKEFIIVDGILKTSTKNIAEYCNVAHGTLFSHFNNREQLISEVLKKELFRISKKLYRLKNENSTLEELLYEYLHFVSDEEKLLVVVNNEFPFFNNTLKREIITTESIVKNLFYNKIEQGIAQKIYKAINITTAISFLFGIINYYLSRREYFVSSGSVILEKMEEIVNTFLIFIKE